jgi:Ser/Thr protein kinase RdoA (MazF antagonist)
MANISYIYKTYGLSQGSSIQLIRESSDNDVYLIESSGSKYILRVSKKDKQKDILYEVELLDQLFLNNFPVPQIIKTNAGSLFSETEDGLIAVLFTFVPGVVITVSPQDEPPKSSVVAAAKTLASLHNLSENIKITNSTTRTIYSELENVLTLKKLFEIEFEGGKEFIHQVEEMILWGKKQHEIPAIIHNDFRCHNVILSPKKDKVNAVIDFDWSCQGPAIKDVAMAVCEWSFPDGALQPWEDVFSNFLNTYNTHAHTQFKDELLLRRWVAFSCLSDAATYFYDRITTNNLNKKVISSYMYKKFKYFIS